ncbi:MAG: TetR/AcrR family transcriptional regulator C-terminal domain-containing protein [Sphaerochaeta sp.]
MNTKVMLSQSLKKLMLTNNLDKITVTQVTQLCGINRQTFYYHFKDLYDLVYWTLDNEEKVLVGENYKANSTDEIMINLYDYIIANEQTICAVYYSLSQDVLERYLVDRVGKYIFILLKRHCDYEDVDDEILQRVTDFYKYAIVGLVFDWIRKGLGRDYEGRIDKLGNFLEKSILNSVKILIEEKKTKIGN